MPPATTPAPANLLTPLRELAGAFAKHRIAYALVGGVATSYRSRPRFTNDLDFLLVVPQLVLPNLLEDLRRRGFDLDPMTVIPQWTREHMTVLSYKGVRIDWLKPAFPLYQHVLERAPLEPWEGGIHVATAEGLILVKLLAFRTQDQLDIESLLGINQGRMDLEWIRSEWNSSFPLADSKMQWFEDRVRIFYATPS